VTGIGALRHISQRRLVMYYPDDVQHLEAFSGLVGRWVLRWTRTRSLHPVTAATHRAAAGQGR
jgi:hypothetical protein